MSSSGAETGFADLVVRSLAVLERECPGAMAEAARRLGARTAAVVVDGEPFALAAEGGRLRRIPLVPDPAAELSTDSATVLDLLEGGASLLEALLDGRLRMRGAADDLIAFHDGLMAYLHGGVRSPGFPPLLRELRRGVGAGG